MKYVICFEWIIDLNEDGTYRLIGAETPHEPDEVEYIYNQKDIFEEDVTLWAIDPTESKYYQIELLPALGGTYWPAVWLIRKTDLPKWLIDRALI